MGKLLHQLHLNHSSAGPSPVATAMEAVVQGNYLRSMVHHLLNDFLNWLKEADAFIIPASFQDEGL